jgi:hypothetical protein
MSEQTVTGFSTDGADTSTRLLRAALAGVAAGVVFGLMIQFVLERMTAIGAMYTLGEPSVSVGWVAHMAHSALFGVVFAVVTWWRPLEERVGSPAGSSLAGAGFGFVLWFVNIGFVWPLWLNAVGVEMLSFPYLAPRPLVGHLIWGVLLGAGFWVLSE